MKPFVISLAKSVVHASRLFGNSGSALPGLIAEKLQPSLLKDMLAQLPEGVVIVTGTNGKTTTTKIISELLREQGKRVLTNKSGSNFTRGVLSTLIEKAGIMGDLPYDIAILELDEAYARVFTSQVKPRLLVALNVLRDQLDRYGEITKTAQLIGDAAKDAQMVILNADDPPIAALKQYLTGKEVLFFGINAKLRKNLPSDEELHSKSINKKQPKKEKPDLELVNSVEHETYQSLTFLADNNKRCKGTLQLGGLYNAANATAALLGAYVLEPSVGIEKLSEKLSTISPAFGRGETLVVQDRHIVLGLIKNPAGFNQNLAAFINDDVDAVLVAINDRYADGRDVSWLWDVNILPLKTVAKIYASGLRAYDMALRLQYEDIPVAGINRRLKSSVQTVMEATKPGDTIVILPTYTAMLAVRKMFAKETEVEDIF